MTEFARGVLFGLAMGFFCFPAATVYFLRYLLVHARCHICPDEHKEKSRLILPTPTH